jgi:Flp pilus assembly protein TadG
VILLSFIFMVLGGIEVFRLLMVEQAAIAAARAAARVAALDDTTMTDVQGISDAALQGYGARRVPVQISPDWATRRRGQLIAVTVVVPFREANWLGAPFLLPDVSAVGQAVVPSERSGPGL